jgi:hypothetical protein
MSWRPADNWRRSSESGGEIPVSRRVSATPRYKQGREDVWPWRPCRRARRVCTYGKPMMSKKFEPSNDSPLFLWPRQRYEWEVGQGPTMIRIQVISGGQSSYTTRISRSRVLAPPFLGPPYPTMFTLTTWHPPRLSLSLFFSRSCRQRPPNASSSQPLSASQCWSTTPHSAFGFCSQSHQVRLLCRLLQPTSCPSVLFKPILRLCVFDMQMHCLPLARLLWMISFRCRQTPHLIRPR